MSTRLRASFEKIDISSVSSSSDDTTKNDDDDDDDDDESDKELPNDLFDAVNTAASSTSRAISAGQLGIIVELLIPELWDPISGNVMANPGDQLKQWEISRQFAQKLLEERSDECEVTVVFPDAGCAALLKNRWGDNLKFKIASANDRMLVPDDYEGIFVIRGGGSDIVGRGGEIDEESERVAKSGDFVEPSISERGCGDWIDRETMERSVFGCHVRGVFAETFAVV